MAEDATDFRLDLTDQIRIIQHWKEQQMATKNDSKTDAKQETEKKEAVALDPGNRVKYGDGYAEVLGETEHGIRIRPDGGATITVKKADLG